MKGDIDMNTTLRVIAAIITLFVISTAFKENSLMADPLPKKEKSKNSGWIGIIVQDVSEKLMKKYKLNSSDGAYIEEVVDDSPADSAGIKAEDVIVEFDSKKIYDAEDLARAVKRKAPGTKVSILLVRDGEKKTIPIVVGANKKIVRHKFKVLPHVPDIRVCVGSQLLGLKLITLNEQLGEYFGAPNNEGVLIEEVEKESAGEKAGLKAGDIITRVGKKMVTEVEKVQKEFEKYDEGEKVEIEIIRKGSKKMISVEMEEEPTIQKRFQLHRPRLHMFPPGHFDDTDFEFKINKDPVEFDNLREILEEARNNIDKSKKIIQEHIQSYVPTAYCNNEL